jgi:hypothetical protein
MAGRRNKETGDLVPIGAIVVGRPKAPSKSGGRSRKSEDTARWAGRTGDLYPKAIAPLETDDAGTLPRPTQLEFENRQLTLFQNLLANTVEERDRLSHAIELWDSTPRYSLNRKAMNKARVNNKFLDPRELSFQHKGCTYTLVVAPARLKDADGVFRDYFPGATEELVEEALRKLAIEKQAGYFDEPNYRSGVLFSLHELRQELKSRGHTRSLQQCVHALSVLAHSVLTIKPHAEGEAQIAASCLPSLVAVSRAKLNNDPKSKWQVQFHPLVTASIDHLDYRQHNYHLSMSLTTQLARWLNKQLVLKYTAASLMNPFDMRYSTIRRDSHLLERYARPRDAIAAIEDAFAELKDRDVLMQAVRNDVLGERGKLLDVAFVLTPSARFVAEVKAANKRVYDARTRSVACGR